MRVRSLPKNRADELLGMGGGGGGWRAQWLLSLEY
jgi:hypothetical protein